MRIRTMILPAATLLLTSVQALCQSPWDAVGLASGWARVDMTGICQFYDRPSQQFHYWSKDGSMSGSLPGAKLAVTPERWVADPIGNMWVVSGTSLIQLERSGKIGTTRTLPAEVCDMVRDASGFYLAYKGATPYVEFRSYKNGSREWSMGTEPKSETGPALSRLAIGDDGKLLLVHGASLGCTVIDPAKGRAVGTISCETLDGQPAPQLKEDTLGRGAVGFWYGRNILFEMVRGSELPGGTAGQVALIRFDLGKKAATTQPLDMAEDYWFVGMTDADAVFIRAKDKAGNQGLAFVPMQ